MAFPPSMVLLATFALAGQGMVGTGKTWKCPFSSWEQATQHYVPARECTVEAVVRKVKLTRLLGKDPALYVILSHEGQDLVVLVAPVSYVEGKRFLFWRGLRVVCTGSKRSEGECEVMIAREVKAGKRTLVLRDQGGKPLWKSKESRPQPKPAAKPNAVHLKSQASDFGLPLEALPRFPMSETRGLAPMLPKDLS